MAERPDYVALAQDINLHEITSCERNANILRMLRDGDPNLSKRLFIMNEDDEDEEDMENFVIDEGDDLGWFGYFIGKCDGLESLDIDYLPEGGDGINRFFDGMSQNRSIKFLAIYSQIGHDGWSSFGSFFENNRNLSNVFIFGHEGGQKLASALGRMNHHSLERLSMTSTNISGEDLAEVATALRSQPRLQSLSLGSNNIGRDGCIALGAALSRWPASNNLEWLNLHSNAIDDGGLQALVSGLMNCCSVTNLSLASNRSITAAGLRSLSPLFQSESHSLERLLLCGINFGDDGATALAEGLRGNKILKELSFETAGMTSVGWSAFSRLLCDTSTINNTYLSNHTLTRMGNRGTPEDIQRLLTLNLFPNAAICKILQSHPDLDMEPFLKSKMKFLPVVMSWFEGLCQSRKLSALYKFVRGMPDLAVPGYWEGRVIDIGAKKRRLAEIKQLLDDQEAVAWERLGGRPIDDASKRKRMRHE